VRDFPQTLLPLLPHSPSPAWAFGAGAQAINFVSRVDREHYREPVKLGTIYPDADGSLWVASTSLYGIDARRDGSELRQAD